MTMSALKKVDLGPSAALSELLLSRPPASEPVLATTAAAAAKPTVLVVDDTPANLTLLANLLNKHYRVLIANSGAKALEIAMRSPPDVVVLDVMMPLMDGYEVCRRLKADPRTCDAPVLFLTALSQPADEARGFEAGGADFVQKPFHPQTVLARVATQAQVKAWRDALKDRNAWLQEELVARVGEVERLRDTTLFVMISLAEFRDQETGNHVRRTQEYVRTLATWLATESPQRIALSAAEIDQLARSAPLHDIGKVAIPDAILLKPGPLSADEWVVMRTHPMHGWELLRRASNRIGEQGMFLTYAMEIARHHHEKWDGSGYPDGLAGEDIPLSARLMATADVYDALISRRPYKEPMSHETAIAWIRSQSGSHFDPVVVDALEATQQRLREIALLLKD
ncbi:MAG: two-component system response regulator [Burkholderiaceae bacterium]